MKVQNVEVSDTTGDDKKYATREIKIIAAFIEANEKIFITEIITTVDKLIK